MNCILLLFLLGCCGGSDNGGSGSGCGYNRTSSLGNGNNIGGYRTSDNNGCGCQGNVSPINDGCGCQGNVSPINDDCGCGQDGDFRSNFDNPGQNPPGWQAFPEISRRDNDCGCDN